MLGDSNTRYFQMVVDDKHRKKRDHENGKIEGWADLKAYNAQFYKKLFGPLEENNFTLDELRKDDVTQVTQAKNEFLVSL